MKRFGNLYHRIYDIDNLYLAYSKAKKGNYQFFPVDSRGIDFVGYVFFHTHTLMRKSIKKNFCRKVPALNKKNITPHDYKMEICSWLGWAKHCNSKHLIKKIIKNEKIQ